MYETNSAFAEPALTFWGFDAKRYEHIKADLQVFTLWRSDLLSLTDL